MGKNEILKEFVIQILAEIIKNYKDYVIFHIEKIEYYITLLNFIIIYIL